MQGRRSVGIANPGVVRRIWSAFRLGKLTSGLLVIRPNLASVSTALGDGIVGGGLLEPTDLATLAQIPGDWERARDLLQAFG
jgi:hypothetical protein